MSDDNIIDKITELVDHQMLGGESCGAQDYCAHCGRHWHGLPLTERVVEMYNNREYDESYRVDTDSSPIVCPGSMFIGPMPAASDGSHPAVQQRPDPTYIEQQYQQIMADLDAEVAQMRIRYWEKEWRGLKFLRAILVFAVVANSWVVIDFTTFKWWTFINVGCLVLNSFQWRQNRRRMRSVWNERPHGASSESRWHRWCRIGWGRVVSCYRKGGTG